MVKHLRAPECQDFSRCSAGLALEGNRATKFCDSGISGAGRGGGSGAAVLSLPGEGQDSVCKDADERLNAKDQLGSASSGVSSGGITHLAVVSPYTHWPGGEGRALVCFCIIFFKRAAWASSCFGKTQF